MKPWHRGREKTEMSEMSEDRMVTRMSLHYSSLSDVRVHMGPFRNHTVLFPTAEVRGGDRKKAITYPRPRRNLNLADFSVKKILNHAIPIHLLNSAPDFSC